MELIGCKFKGFDDGFKYEVKEELTNHPGMFQCVGYRGIRFFTKEQIEAALSKKPLWSSENPQDPNIYASLEDILKYLLCINVMEANALDRYIEQYKIRKLFGISFNGQEHVIQGDGIRWFIQQFPETLAYFFPD